MGKCSLAHLERAFLRNSQSIDVNMRLYRARISRGDWENAEQLVEKIKELAPSTISTYLTQIDCLAFTGREKDAIAVAHEGVMRLGPETVLPSELAVLMSTTLTGEELDENVQKTAIQFASMNGFSLKFANALLDAGKPQAALTVYETALEVDPGDVNLRWNYCQGLSGFASLRNTHREKLESQLLDLFQVYNNRYLHIVVLLAEQLLSKDPEKSLSYVTHEEVDIGIAPVLAWDLVARAFAALGNEDEAASLRERITTVWPVGVTQHTRFLVSTGRIAIALRLLEDIINAKAHNQQTLEEYSYCLFHNDQMKEAYEMIQKVEKPPSLMLINICAANEEWDQVIKAADKELLATEYRTTAPTQAWWHRGAKAVAQLGLGNSKPLEDLLIQVGNDGLTLSKVHGWGKSLTHPLMDEVENKLKAASPGRLKIEARR